MKKSSLILAAAALTQIVSILNTSAVLGGITTSGAVQFVTDPPSDVSSNQWQSNTIIRAFAEQQNLTLSQSLPTDISVAGTSPSATSKNLSPSTIAAGTTIDCFMLHFDKNGSNANVIGATGSITFDEPILGLLITSDSQNATNTLLGLPNTAYSTGNDHGMEIVAGGGGNNDFVTISPDLRTVTVDLNSNFFADDLRVITAVPEPAMAGLFIGGMLWNALRRRRSP